MNPSQRIANQKPYYFDSVHQSITRLEAEGMDIIRLDMGSPDLPPASFIVEELVSAARDSSQHGYSPYGGTLEFREAVRDYYLNRFDVVLDPVTEVLGLIGSKEGIFHISLALLDPGDIAIVPQPGYPTYRVGARMSGAEVYSIPLLEKNDYIPDLDQIPDEVAGRAKVLWLNYPNNPTGAIASYDRFHEIVEFALENQILILHDAPYMEIYYGDSQPMSILEIPRAMEIAIEFNSLSKTYNMAGWRVGMAVGNRELISYLHAVKMQVDTSHFLPIQTAAIAALTGDQNWLKDRNRIYKQRLDIVLTSLSSVNLAPLPPEAAIYVWFRLPDALDDRQFCADLLHSTGVSMTPGSVYGDAGKGYARVSLCTPEDRLSEAMDRVTEWMKVRT